MSWNLENMLTLYQNSYDKIFSSISLHFTEIFNKWGTKIDLFLADFLIPRLSNIFNSFLVQKNMSTIRVIPEPFFYVSHFFKSKRRTEVSWLKKCAKNCVSSYINWFISNRRKINSKKELCSDTHLDMLFWTKKNSIYWMSPGTRKIWQKIKKSWTEKMEKDFTIHNKIRFQPRKLQMGWNLEDMLELEWKTYGKIFIAISLRLMEVFIKWG